LDHLQHLLLFIDHSDPLVFCGYFSYYTPFVRRWRADR
jgi:hypothetical protein